MEKLLEIIGFSAEEKEEILSYYKEERRLLPVTEAYLDGMAMEAVTEKLKGISTENVHLYTLELLFALSVAKKMYESYKKLGIPDKIYCNTVKDIKYKFDECAKFSKVLGLNNLMWYDGFFRLKRFAFGRLQYDVIESTAEDITAKSRTIPKGSFALNCHIPSSGPLKYELCIASYKEAYEYYRERLQDGILTVLCDSWLLYPPYRRVFGEKSNIKRFAGDFTIYNVRESDTFSDAWRVFNMPYEGYVSKLPQDTSLQKSFAEYIKSGGKFGNGMGVLLFDGNNII